MLQLLGSGVNDAAPCQVRRGLGGAVELNGCAQADFSPSVSQGAPKIDFGEARFRCVAFLISNRVEIMWYVMCACVVHARQVIPYLQESILYESLTVSVRKAMKATITSAPKRISMATAARLKHHIISLHLCLLCSWLAGAGKAIWVAFIDAFE